MADLIKTVLALEPKAHFSNGFDGYSSIIWHSKDVEQPTEEQCNAKFAELQAEFDAQAYARSRKEEYDALNQFELISDDSINGTTTHKDAVNAIKVKYPKPE